MNCKNAQLDALLLESDELTSRRKRKLEQHLATCPHCAGLHVQTRRLLALAGRAGAVAEGPSPFVVTRILAHAREALSTRPVFLFRPAVQFAAAAMLLILAVGWWSLAPVPGQGKTAAEGIGDVQAILTVLSDEEHAASEQQAATQEDVLRQLAGQLLQSEGGFEEETTGEESWEPQSTTPQSHSIPASPAGIRV